MSRPPLAGTVVLWALVLTAVACSSRSGIGDGSTGSTAAGSTATLPASTLQQSPNSASFSHAAVSSADVRYSTVAVMWNVGSSPVTVTAWEPTGLSGLVIDNVQLAPNADGFQLGAGLKAPPNDFPPGSPYHLETIGVGDNAVEPLGSTPDPSQPTPPQAVWVVITYHLANGSAWGTLDGLQLTTTGAGTQPARADVRFHLDVCQGTTACPAAPPATSSST